MEQELNSVLLVSTISLLIISIGFVLFIIFFYRTQKKQLMEKKERELFFLSEVNTIKEEIQSQTLKHIGSELHDNIGQLLAVSIMQSNALAKEPTAERAEMLNTILHKTVVETRSLSHQLTKAQTMEFDLVQAIEQELLRFKIPNFKIIQSIQLTDDIFKTGNKGILIFRVVQEFITNSIKHSGASAVNVSINQNQQGLIATISDNGKGFDIEQTKQGVGLTNIRNRIKLLGGSVSLHSEPNEGVKIQFIIPG